MSDKKSSVILLDRLQETLLKIGNTNEEIAKALGCDHSTINKWYNGKLTPSLDKIVSICEKANVSIDYLCGFREEPTNNAEISDICDYTGLSKKSIEAIRQLCIPDFSTIIYEEGTEDYNYEKDWLIKDSQIKKHSINTFISSNSFEYLIKKASQLTDLNNDALAYLSLCFNDFKYFNNLAGDDYDIVTNAELFTKEYTNDALHNALQDKQDLIIFNIQRCIVSYFENFSNVLFEINDKGLARTFDWLRFVVFDAIKAAIEDDKNVDTFINRMSEYGALDEYKEDISKLKEIFERMKSND